MNEISDNARAGTTPVWANVLLPEAQMEEIARMEADLEKVKNCYPSQVATIRYMVEDTCDRLEYEGSPMFAELPDSETVHQLAREIYSNITDDDDSQMIPCISWGENTEKTQCINGQCRIPDEAVPAWNGGRGTPPPGCRGRGCVPPYVPDCDKGNCILRQLIEVMLLNEMSHRRNRYYYRKRW